MEGDRLLKLSLLMQFVLKPMGTLASVILMAKLPIEESEAIWTLKRQLLEIVDTATAAAEALFSNQGETELTITVLDELKRVSE